MSTVYLILLSPVALLLALYGASFWRPLRVLRRIARGFFIFFLALGVMLSTAQLWYSQLPYPSLSDMQWGVSFAASMSTYLGQDWQQSYTAILDDLHPSVVRLVAYWDDIEATEGQYDFSVLDWQVSEAAKRHIDVIIVIGQKTPHWPECHYPGWLDRTNRPAVQDAVQKFFAVAIPRYKDQANLRFWQVENEPYLKFADFAQCPKITSGEVAQEIQQVHSLDPHHQVATTDSGEAGAWLTSLRQGDIFGTTMYRQVYDTHFNRIDTYPYTPQMYAMRRDLAELLSGTIGKKTYITELQAEPWGPKPIGNMTSAEQQQYFTPQNFDDIITFAQQSRIGSPVILWGAEWWYAMKQQGVPVYWQRAQALMNPTK